MIQRQKDYGIPQNEQAGAKKEQAEEKDRRPVHWGGGRVHRFWFGIHTKITGHKDHALQRGLFSEVRPLRQAAFPAEPDAP